ncbi:MAG TPA: hypothetical protein VNO52_01580, partial [Methylomirabilota bacterium]|nr:hypothetical protein [Methylomirabilota bacterium]
MITLRTNIAAAFLIVLVAGGVGEPRSTSADLATNLPAAAEASALSPATTNADMAGATSTNAAATARSEAEEALRLFLAVQEARHAQRLAAESDPARDSAAVRALEEKLATRLETIERGLAAQRDRDAASWQASHRTLLSIAVACAALCMVTIVATSFFQWRTLSRLTSVGATTLVPGLPVLSGPGPTSPEAGVSGRWPEIIDRLER